MRRIRGDNVGQENSFELQKSETLAQELESITSGLRMAGAGIGFITLLGASIALMNIMLVSVTERTREVGVRKALGATPLRIRQQFVIEAIVVCLLGGFAGIILGILIGNLLSRLMNIEVFVIPWMEMLIGLVVCIVVGLISGYYPAHKASKLDPIESLRFE
jgi:putative ABC transport system permease protein